MTHPALGTLVETGDIAAVRSVLETQSVRDKDVSWAVMQCIKFKRREILDVLLDHTRTHLQPRPNFFAGPLAWAASAGEDTHLFDFILKAAPSNYGALSTSLVNLMEQEQMGADQYVMAKFALWCDKADNTSLHKALSDIVVWNLTRFLHHIYPKWVASASEEQNHSALFKNLIHCYSWGEGKQGVHIRHPHIYDFLLTQVSPSVAQHFLDKIAHDKSANHFQYMPGIPGIYALLEPVFESVVQHDVLTQVVDDGAVKPAVARKL